MLFVCSPLQHIVAVSRSRFPPMIGRSFLMYVRKRRTSVHDFPFWKQWYAWLTLLLPFDNTRQQLKDIMFSTTLRSGLRNCRPPICQTRTYSAKMATPVVVMGLHGSMGGKVSSKLRPEYEGQLFSMHFQSSA